MLSSRRGEGLGREGDLVAGEVICGVMGLVAQQL